MFRHLILLLLTLVCIGVSAPSRAEDERAFRASGVASTEQQAVVEAYYQGLVRELARFAGAQAEGDVGQQFRRDFERDFTNFRKRYFTPDTDHRCLPKGERIACEVEGTIKVLALQTDFAKVMKTTERTLSNSLTFVVSAADTKDPKGPVVVDKLTAVFLEAGNKVLSGSAVNKAIADRKVDFSLAVLELAFAPASFDPAEQKAHGSLTVRFKLNDLRGGTQVASVPVTVSDTVSGPTIDVVRDDLDFKLATKAAVEIGRQVNSALVNFQVNREDNQAAAQRAAVGGKMYLVRLEGVAQRDRDKIRLIRETITSRIPDGAPQIEPGQTTPTKVTVSFSTTRKVDPEDLIDALYAAHSSITSFEATYAGNNEFLVHY